jgi:glycosyltransferase involved in cell wall biosynthesis
MSFLYFPWDQYAEKRKRSIAERRYMMQRWSSQILKDDPCYNPNLSLQKRNYNIDTNSPLRWHLDANIRTKCFGIPLSGGSGEYRLRQPFDALSKFGLAQCQYGERTLGSSELARLAPNVLVIQNAFKEVELDYLKLYKEFMPEIKVIFLLDDLVQSVPEKSAQFRVFQGAFRDATKRLRDALKYCDRLLVSTAPLEEVCRDMIDDIVTVPNRLSSELWLQLDVPNKVGEKPRVGWAGAQQHQGDLELIFEVVKETAEEIDWIFMGMCPDEILPFVKESHDFVPLDEYPQKLASLALDLAIAPLEMNEFNEAKSNLRLLEYGVLGWPVICTDIYPYQTNNPPVTRVVNTKEAWLEAIRTALANPEQTKQAGDALKEWVLAHYILEDHLDEWAEALYVEKLPEGQ